MNAANQLRKWPSVKVSILLHMERLSKNWTPFIALLPPKVSTLIYLPSLDFTEKISLKTCLWRHQVKRVTMMEQGTPVEGPWPNVINKFGGIKLNVFYVDLKRHQRIKTESMFAKYVVSSNGVHVAVLNKWTIFGKEIGWNFICSQSELLDSTKQVISAINYNVAKLLNPNLSN